MLHRTQLAENVVQFGIVTLPRRGLCNGRRTVLFGHGFDILSYSLLKLLPLGKLSRQGLDLTLQNVRIVSLHLQCLHLLLQSTILKQHILFLFSKHCHLLLQRNCLFLKGGNALTQLLLSSFQIFHFLLIFYVDLGLLGQLQSEIHYLSFQIFNPLPHLFHLNCSLCPLQFIFKAAPSLSIHYFSTFMQGGTSSVVSISIDLLFLLRDDANKTGHKPVALGRLRHPSFFELQYFNQISINHHKTHTHPAKKYQSLGQN